MASIGHLVVGMAAARIYRHRQMTRWSWAASAATWSVLSMLPDADVIGFALGVQYGDEWGHRGATHSFVFSAILGLAIGVAAPLFRLAPARTAIVASLVFVSHALLDTLTDGGLGCALLWPFDLTRYFAPWNPIPVAPIGPAFFSFYGLTVALTEAILFLPVLLLALPSIKRVSIRGGVWKLLFAAWMVVVWLLVSHDPVRESVMGRVFREDTQYSTGYSEDLFASIRVGQSDEEAPLIGTPLGRSWFYDADGPAGCAFVHFEDDVVAPPSVEGCERIGITPGVMLTEVERLLGAPQSRCEQYTRGGAGRPFRLRVVCFQHGRVVATVRRWNLAGSISTGP